MEGVEYTTGTTTDGGDLQDFPILLIVIPTASVVIVLVAYFLRRRNG